ncbi:ABC transporter permease [Mumia sp. zg.B21]|uniref:ABC transporter permease n=1 Tax=Mumia sp. zg.B21 TaxID=2855447 RepID=UPI001C6E55D8|nr:ABC transporter permease [Mumia sp. zg.B21]MBW9210674.1 ABC transporter permease [Mumia sp. zg.B21]
MTATSLERRVPPLGGFSVTFVRLELRRLLRNKRTVTFTLVLPAVFFLLFGTSSSYREETAGAGNVTAYVMVSLALYGAMVATTSTGAVVATERALGWSRQLRVTPLNPLAYVAVKVCVAMVLGGVSVVVVNVVGRLAGATLPWDRTLACAALAWLCSLVFAAFGLFVGYLLPTENVMQIVGPVLALLAFAGGLFVPADQLGDLFATVARVTPVYGAAEIVRAPLGDSGSLWPAALNVVAWTSVFVGGAVWRFRKDTARV